MSENKKLTAKQDAFCRHYIANGFNATQAAISAGYSESSAAAIGEQNLRKLEIAEFIEELKKPTIEKAKRGADDVYKLASDAAFFDPSEFLEIDGDTVTFKHGSLTDLPKELRVLIQAVRQRKTKFGDFIEIVFVDKLKALEMLARFNGMNKDTLKVTNTYETKTDEDIEQELKELEGK